MINTIDILEDGKLSAFTGAVETYLQPEIIIDTLDNLQQLIIKDQFGTYVKVDTTISTIKGVAFAGTFADLETAIRDLALESNGLYNGGTGGGGGGGDASAANQLTQITELQTLNAVTGARPSQLAGRLKVTEVIDTAVSVLQRTISAGKTFFITDMVLTIDNSDTGAAGRVNLRDGLTVAGDTVLPLQVQEAPTNETAVQVFSHQFLEPLEFSTGLFIEEGVGINIVTGVIIGYEE